MNRKLSISALAAVFTVLLSACATTQPSGSPSAIIDQAIAAMGGVEAIEDLQSLVISGIHRHYEPQQARQVGQGTGAYIRHMLSAPATAQPDRLARNPRPVEVIEVADKHVLTDGARAVEAYNIDNTHAVGMLIGHMPHAKLGFVTDLWSPGRDKIGPTQGQTELARAVLKLGIPVERFAGGHGTTASFKELAEAVSKKGK